MALLHSFHPLNGGRDHRALAKGGESSQTEPGLALPGTEPFAVPTACCLLGAGTGPPSLWTLCKSRVIVLRIQG